MKNNLLIFTIISLVIAIAARLLLGSYMKFDNLSTLWSVILTIRVPKLFLAFITGATLATCGLILQILLKNPLAGPFTMGISAGASFGAVVLIFVSLFISNYALMTYLPISAFAGAMITFLIIFIIIRNTKNTNPSLLILTGVVINSLFSSFITLLISLLSNKAHIAINWMMGHISRNPSMPIPLIYVSVFLILPFIFIYKKEIEILYLNDSSASNLGVNVSKTKSILLIIATLLTSIIVSQTGIIGFVGIIIPHIIKFKVSIKFTKSFIYSFLWGGIFLIICDTFAQIFPRLLGMSGEIPIGAVTALIGSPIFIHILISQRKDFTIY